VDWQFNAHAGALARKHGCNVMDILRTVMTGTLRHPPDPHLPEHRLPA
jgi:hypothetical protein